MEESAPEELPDEPLSAMRVIDLRFANFLEDIVAHFDSQHRHIFVNSAVERVTGMSSDSFLGRTNRELGMPAHLVEQWEHALGEVFRTGERREIRFRFEGPQGLRELRTELAPEFDGRGAVQGVVTWARDVTQFAPSFANPPLARPSADPKGWLSPEAANEHFHAIVDSSDDAIISKTLDGIITSWNRGATAIFGYQAEEMLGQSMELLFPPDRRDEERFILEKLVLGEKVDHFETVRVCKGGQLVHVSVTISPIRNRLGEIVGASKVARDITRQKAAEDRLRLIANVFTHSGEAIVITDSKGRMVDVNEAFSRITGYRRDQVLGRDHRLLNSERQDPQVLRSMRLSLERYGQWHGELWNRRQDGASFPCNVTVSRVLGPEGRVHSYVALFADVTQLHAQKEQLQHVAHYDVLTGLANRLLLFDRLQQAMARVERSGESLAVVYLDLDGFKPVNDRHGHAMGDELLVAVAERMRAVLRSVDTLARIGGDEFVAVLTHLKPAADCTEQVQRILAACAEPFLIQGQFLCISASVGVTLYPRDRVDVDHLLRHADRAMYRAKQAGKNRFHMFDPLHDI